MPRNAFNQGLLSLNGQASAGGCSSLQELEVGHVGEGKKGVLPKCGGGYKGVLPNYSPVSPPEEGDEPSPVVAVTNKSLTNSLRESFNRIRRSHTHRWSSHTVTPSHCHAVTLSGWGPTALYCQNEDLSPLNNLALPLYTVTM